MSVEVISIISSSGVRENAQGELSASDPTSATKPCQPALSLVFILSLIQPFACFCCGSSPKTWTDREAQAASGSAIYWESVGLGEYSVGGRGRVHSENVSM